MGVLRQLRSIGRALGPAGVLAGVQAGILTGILTGIMTGLLPSAASAYPARVPQVVLHTGSDGVSLHTYLSSVGEHLNTQTSQLDLQTWQAPVSGNATFSLRIEIAGYARSNSVGVYNAAATTPARFLVFPGAAARGWYATCVFGSSGQLTVRLFDSHHVLQGVTNYTGVDRDNFGFYLEGPAGTFWSQDSRNAGGKPQALAYAGTGSYTGRWWTCFEDLPFGSSDVDFQDSILLLESVAPTPVRSGTWGALKALYR